MTGNEQSAGIRVLFVEPVSGISGDMFLGALIDLGVSLDTIRTGLAKLGLGGYTIATREVRRAGMRALKFDVDLVSDDGHSGRDHAGHDNHGREHHHHDHPGHGGHEHHEHEHSHEDAGHHPHAHRSFQDIRRLIGESGLSPWVKGRSLDAFGKLAEAEARVHGCPVDDVSFHEVGAVDSIVDIVGAMVALETLQPLRVVSSAVNTGHGTLTCQHGVYPVPAPATESLLRGIPVFSNSVGGELTTPTGAVLLATLAGGFGPRPSMRVLSAGYGAGFRDFPGAANVLRVSLGEVEISGAGVLPEDEVAVLEAAVDDLSPQVFGHLLERLMEQGALDVCMGAVQMKKNRPGVMLTVLCVPGAESGLAELVFRETTTLGIRVSRQKRFILDRSAAAVETEYGPVRVKLSGFGGRVFNCVPEYDDCRRIALERNLPVRDVIAAAAAAGRSNMEWPLGPKGE
jgi:pyridinium-3,5-bisthiocarboxylic acid mononucleotide nickel chelatase